MTDWNDQSDATRPTTAMTAHWARHLTALTGYWESMRKQGDVPRRSEIDPRGIAPLLEYAFIAERIAPGIARLRLAGTHLSDLMGMEVRGMPLSAFVAPAGRPVLADALTELFERPAKADIVLTAPGSSGRPALRGHLVLLPLRSDLGDISRALGVLITEGMIGRSPRRFDIASHRIIPVGLKADGRLAAGFAEAPAPFATPEPQHASERPYLRVVR